MIKKHLVGFAVITLATFISVLVVSGCGSATQMSGLAQRSAASRRVDEFNTALRMQQSRQNIAASTGYENVDLSVQASTSDGQLVIRSQVQLSFGESKKIAKQSPPGSLPSLDEEVWVIVKPPPAGQVAETTSENIPGSGALM